MALRGSVQFLWGGSGDDRVFGDLDELGFQEYSIADTLSGGPGDDYLGGGYDDRPRRDPGLQLSLGIAQQVLVPARLNSGWSQIQTRNWIAGHETERGRESTRFAIDIGCVPRLGLHPCVPSRLLEELPQEGTFAHPVAAFRSQVHARRGRSPELWGCLSPPALPSLVAA